MILHYVLEFTRVDTNTAVLHLTSLFYRILKNEETTRRVRCCIFSSSQSTVNVMRHVDGWWMWVMRWFVEKFYFIISRFVFCLLWKEGTRGLLWVRHLNARQWLFSALIMFLTNKRFQHARVSNNGVKVNMKFQTLGWLIFFLLKGENTVLKRCHRLLFRLAFASFFPLKNILEWKWKARRGLTLDYWNVRTRKLQNESNFIAIKFFEAEQRKFSFCWSLSSNIVEGFTQIHAMFNRLLCSDSWF